MTSGVLNAAFGRRKRLPADVVARLLTVSDLSRVVPRHIQPIPASVHFCSELKNGIQIKNDKDVPLGYSKIAAQKAIAATVFSRIALAFPPLAAVAFGMQYYEDRGTFCRYPWTRVPVACAISAVMFAVATPLALALFRQRSEMPVRQLETELQVRARPLRTLLGKK